VKDIPLVTIGIPVFNEERFLSQAIESALGQEHENLEIVICDNASSDGTADICREYALRDRRIRYFRNDGNLGGVGNFNRVLELATGEFFMWLGGHDILHPQYVSQCLKLLLQDKQVVLGYPLCSWVNAGGESLCALGSDRFDTRGLSRLARLNIVLWSTTGNAVHGVIRTETLRSVGGFRICAAPDYVLLAELSLVGTFALVPESLLTMRVLRMFTWEERLEWLRTALRPEGKNGGFSLPYWRLLGKLMMIPRAKGLGWRASLGVIGSVVWAFSIRLGWALAADVKRIAAPRGKERGAI
jgi:glycosyltransferase involved in cell wall biosynthesis